jgi:hypothetical protein
MVQRALTVAHVRRLTRSSGADFSQYNIKYCAKKACTDIER